MRFAQYCRLNLHIMDSNRMLLREASRKLVKEHRYARNGIRRLRHAYYRDMLAEHKDAQELYRRVVLCS